MARTAWPRRRHGTVAVLTLFASAVHAVLLPEFRNGHFECPAGSFPKGVVIDLGRSTITVNNLGGYLGNTDTETVECMVGTDGVTNAVEDYCPCGCGCKCLNTALREQPQEMRFAGAARAYDGTSNEPYEEFDLVVTNTTEYKPWSSAQNGLFSGGDSREAQFGSISQAQDTTTTFLFTFLYPGTQAKPKKSSKLD